MVRAAPTTPTKVSLRFGNGIVDITNLTLGAASQNPHDYQCLVVQRGGSAKITSLVIAPVNATTVSGRQTSRYQLHGGTLELGNVTSQGNFTMTGILSRGLDWHGGTIQPLSSQSTTFSAIGTGVIPAPLELALSGTVPKTLNVETGRTFTLGSGTRLSSDSSLVTLQKIGNGTLALAGDSTAFTGNLHLHEGILSPGQNTTPATAHTGAFTWNSGTLAFDLSPTGLTSDRFTIDRTFIKSTGTPANRVLSLKSSLGSGTYTLATYASTDLTLADFTATGIRSGYTADFTVGPTELTVTLSPASALATWRTTHFSTASNLGPAADLADPDSDGRPNLLEYALASEPTSADSAAPLTLARLPASDASPARLALTFTRIADPGLTYAVRAAASPAGPWTEVIYTSTGSDNTPGSVTVTDPADLASHPRRFLRLFVSR